MVAPLSVDPNVFERRLAPFVEQFVALTRVPGMAVGVVAQGDSLTRPGLALIVWTSAAP